MAAALSIAAGLVAGCAPAEQQEITITQRPTAEAAPADVARALAPGEATTIDDYTFENQGSQVVVSRGAHTFTMANGQFTASTPPLADATKPAGNNAPEGSYCGSLEHGYRIIALEDGTDCPTALATFEDYLSGSPKGGEPQGQAQFYTAPDTGWGCARGFRFPWEENIGANMKPTCSPKNGAGGSAAALGKEDVR